MNDKEIQLREKVLRDFLDMEPADDVIISPDVEYWAGDAPDVWFIAAISTRFAELGKDVFLRKSNKMFEVVLITFMHNRPLPPYQVVFKSIISTGPTPYEAWMDAALNECRKDKE